jgi:hypothetical protein
MLFIYPKGITVGIPCEMMYGWMNHKNMYAVVPDELLNHPWIKSLCNDHVYNFTTDAVEKMRSDFEYLLAA